MAALHHLLLQRQGPRAGGVGAAQYREAMERALQEMDDVGTFAVGGKLTPTPPAPALQVRARGPCCRSCSLRGVYLHAASARTSVGTGSSTVRVALQAHVARVLVGEHKSFVGVIVVEDESSAPSVAPPGLQQHTIVVGRYLERDSAAGGGCGPLEVAATRRAACIEPNRWMLQLHVFVVVHPPASWTLPFAGGSYFETAEWRHRRHSD